MSSALSSDLDVLKDIPGYKAILKSVLKTQIQLLIEQLADHTGEESIILTASVNDGTLSHLGSSTGKGFLDGRDEIKSQFLGFCLKSHHKKKTQEVKSPYQRVNHGNQGQRHIPQRPPQKRPKLHPVTLQRAGSLEGHTGLPQRPVGVPPSPRDDRGPSMSPGMSPRLVRAGDENVKLEGNEQNDSNSESSNFASTPTSFPSTLQLSHTQTSGDQSYSETSHDIGQGQGSQNVGHGQGQLGAEEFNDSAAETSIKIEPITENEMELEITGVEPGNMSSDNWGQGQMGYGPSGSEGDDSQNQSGDQSGYSHWNSTVPNLQPVQLITYDTPQGGEPYTVIYQPVTSFDTTAMPTFGQAPPLSVQLNQPSTSKSKTNQSMPNMQIPHLSPNQRIISPVGADEQSLPFTKENYGKDGDKWVLKKHVCQICGKRCLKPSDLTRHLKIHTGERSFECEKCKKRFRERFNLMAHLKKGSCSSLFHE